MYAGKIKYNEQMHVKQRHKIKNTIKDKMTVIQWECKIKIVLDTKLSK